MYLWSRLNEVPYYITSGPFISRGIGYLFMFAQVIILFLIRNPKKEQRMQNRFQYLITANAMMVANLMSILVSIIITILYYEYSPLRDSLIMEVGWRIGRFTDPAYGVIIILLTFN